MLPGQFIAADVSALAIASICDYVTPNNCSIPSRPIPSCKRDDLVATGHVLCICILTHISTALSRPQHEGVCALAAHR
jgi:hypothetical protein